MQGRLRFPHRIVNADIRLTSSGGQHQAAAALPRGISARCLSAPVIEPWSSSPYHSLYFVYDTVLRNL